MLTGAAAQHSARQRAAPAGRGAAAERGGDGSRQGSVICSYKTLQKGTCLSREGSMKTPI